MRPAMRFGLFKRPTTSLSLRSAPASSCWGTRSSRSAHLRAQQWNRSNGGGSWTDSDPREARYSIGGAGSSIHSFLLLFSGLALFQNCTSAEERKLDREELLDMIDQASRDYSDHRYYEAIEKANKVLYFDPDNVQALFWKGSALLELRSYNDALKVYDHIIDNHDAPPSAVNQAHFFKAQTYQRMNQLKKAIEWYELCAVYHSDEWALRAHYFLGKCHSTLGQNDKALASYNRVIAEFPVDAPERLFAIIEKGMVLKQMNRLQDALEMFERALKQYPEHGHLEKQRLLTLCALNEYDRALKIYDDRLKTNPNDVGALNCKAFVLYRAGRYEDALPAFEQVYKEKPDDLNALTAMGYCELQLGRAQTALEIFRKVAQKNHRYPQALTNIAICFHVQGLYDDAKKMYYEAASLNPTDATAKQFLKLAYQRAPIRHTAYPDPTRTYY